MWFGLVKVLPLLDQITETWWEAPMEGSVLSFLKAEWKVSDTGSAHWASGLIIKYQQNEEGYVFSVKNNL
jgi:hypothetical protein